MVQHLQVDAEENISEDTEQFSTCHKLKITNSPAIAHRLISLPVISIALMLSSIHYMQVQIDVYLILACNIKTIFAALYWLISILHKKTAA